MSTTLATRPACRQGAAVALPAAERPLGAGRGQVERHGAGANRWMGGEEGPRGRGVGGARARGRAQGAQGGWLVSYAGKEALRGVRWILPWHVTGSQNVRRKQGCARCLLEWALTCGGALVACGGTLHLERNQSNLITPVTPAAALACSHPLSPRHPGPAVPVRGDGEPDRVLQPTDQHKGTYQLSRYSGHTV